MKAGSHAWWSLTVLVCAVLSPLAGAATLQVGSGETDLATIQAAVDAAVAGDTIVVSPGVYTGAGNCDIDLRGKVLTIQSTQPLDPNVVARTVIDCAGSAKEPHRGFYIVDCNGVTLSGLTITHGLASAGGAVYCQGSTLELAHCRILDNSALPGGTDYLPGGPGGGLYCEKSTVKVVASLLSGNVAGNGASTKEGQAGAGGNGGGLAAVNSDIQVISSTITRNTAGQGGDGGPGAAGNGGDGGGLCGDSVQVTDSTISNNLAGAGGQGAPSGRGGRGGGVYADIAELDRCIIEANRAGDSGPAGSDAKDKTGASAGDGGGICGNSLTIANSLIAGNRAGRGRAAEASGWLDHGNGGGLWCAAGSVRNCTIVENAVCQSGADPNSGMVVSTGRGGGMFITAKTVLTNSILYQNFPGELAGFDCNNLAYCNSGKSACPKEDSNDFADPLFVRAGRWGDAKDPGKKVRPDDPNAVWVSGDYRLRPMSPSFDAGDPNYLPAADETDLSGKPRLADMAVDLGAYESSALAPVYRFWSPVTGDHFYTMSEAERDKLINFYARVWTPEGIAFYAYARAAEPNLLPVYRFWSSKDGDHFYTINETERAKLLQQNPPGWISEGTAFYAYPAGHQPAGTKPVYRFWSGKGGGHFYTMSEAERNQLLNQKPLQWIPEGIAWYAYETSSTEPAAVKAASYEFSGGTREVLCTLSLKAYLDGKEAKIDEPNLVYDPNHAYLKMTVDLAVLTTTLQEFLAESEVMQHTLTIGQGGTDGVQIPVVLSTSLLFWGQAARGPFGIDAKTSAFPTTGGGPLPGSNESFTINGSATVDGAKLDVGLVENADEFATGASGSFDTSGLPEQLNARLAATFQWSCRQQGLLLDTTVKSGRLQIYVTSAHLQTAGTWQGKKTQ
jgi:hypothetical protein